MGRITVDMIRKRAEHNEGMIASLEELALHQQHIERIELLNKICRRLKILLLQNNIIHKIENLHRMKDLQYLNLALNNITKVQNLQRCESLAKLDLTMNFVSKAGLLSVASLQANEHLADLYLLGNPCTDWSGYRQYVVASIPALTKLDGVDVKPSERIQAQQAFETLHVLLCDELRKEGIDPVEAATVEDDGLCYASDGCMQDPGYIDPADGEFKRPWCPATRILEHRENERIQREQDVKKKAGREGKGGLFADQNRTQRRDAFPDINDGPFFQKNEGEWEFTLDESVDHQAIELNIALSKHLDTSLVKVDIQPGWVRLLVKGKLLQLRLPCNVRPDKASAKRARITGCLLLHMPKESPELRELDLACVRQRHNHVAGIQKPKPQTGPGLHLQPSQFSKHAVINDNQDNVSVHHIVDQEKEGPSLTAIKAVHRANIQAACIADEDAPVLI